MKAYLITSGTIFGLLAAMHIVKAIDERQGFSTEPGHYIAMTVLGALAATLSVWAWRLLARQARS